jgi:putative membrane protein
MDSEQSGKFFTQDERERIRQAVADAERSTSGEIVTMVVERSDSYREAETLGAVLCAALVALVVAVAWHHVTVWSYLPLVCVLFFPARWLIFRFPSLQRPFIGRARLHQAVQERAVRAFYEKGLYRTRHETGILILISLFERKVWILGDRGINSRIPPESWRDLARTLAEGLREGRACEALCSVIAACGTELSRHFPPEDGEHNELPDEVLE